MGHIWNWTVGQAPLTPETNLTAPWATEISLFIYISTVGFHPHTLSHLKADISVQIAPTFSSLDDRQLYLGRDSELSVRVTYFQRNRASAFSGHLFWILQYGWRSLNTSFDIKTSQIRILTPSVNLFVFLPIINETKVGNQTHILDTIASAKMFLYVCVFRGVGQRN